MRIKPVTPVIAIPYQLPRRTLTMTSAEHLKKQCPESVEELKRLYLEGNSIKELSEYYDWSQWTIAELLGERLS